LSIQISQGSAATDLEWGGRFYTSVFSSWSENAIVKELLKLVHICQSYCKKNLENFFWHTLYIIISLKKLSECMKEINDSCSGGSSWPKSELIMEPMTMVNAQKGWIELVPGN